MSASTELKETLAQEAYRLIDGIPKTHFLTHTFTDEKKKCCVIGHYARLKSDNPKDYSKKNCMDYCKPKISALRYASEEFLRKKYGDSMILFDIASINNKDTFADYLEDNPKDRVLHLLTDMIKAGY